MSTWIGLVNLLIGAVYTSYGIMTVFDLQRNQDRGRSWFGLAWIAMAFTCGPHHLDHGLHALLDHQAGALDLAAILVGLPSGVIWFLLRIEGATRRGPGDRAITGLPWLVEVLPVAGAAYLVLFVTLALRTVRTSSMHFNWLVAPNLALVVLYLAIGWALGRTQLANHAITGRWSLSGLSLTVVFPTCALMHGAWALYGSEGRYPVYDHLFAVDLLAVPAAVFFLAVVRGLHRGSLRDWAANVDTATVAVDDDLRLEPVP